MGKKTKANALGRSLIKDKFGGTNKKRVDNDCMLHTTDVQDGYDWGRLNLASVTEESSSFTDFLRTAELAGTEFQAEKLNVTFVNPKSGVGLLSKSEIIRIEKKHSDNKDLIKIPRRPKWSADTTPEELQKAENESFLEWRRLLATLQEDEEILMTPYEKNLEFWRQLWRVVERSDVIVQIVDARNPLLFRSVDLEKYVKEINPNKMNMILVNKSDFLNDQQRQYWADYFQEQNIKVAFFSALLAEEEMKITESKNDTSKDCLTMDCVKEAVNKLSESLDKTEEQLVKIEAKIGHQRNSSKILSRIELIELFRNIYSGPKYTPSVTTIGMVGYPNVGKSSTINTLMIVKKVSVSATPGKTKHFQTLFLDKDLMLCDCPGLVMPSFVLTKADMILNGILPIDQMRDHVPPVNLLCTRIPRHVLEDKYGIIIAKPIEGEDPKRPPHSEELLLAHAYNRGFMTARSQPDQARSARYVCKDYVNGKLSYAVAPPNISQEVYQVFPEKLRKEVEEKNLPGKQQRAMRMNAINPSDAVDKQFFGDTNAHAKVKGKNDFPHTRVSEQGNSDDREQIHAKPWRIRIDEERKAKRRQKLRIKNCHLDQH